VVWAASLDGRARAALQPGAHFAVHSVFEQALNFVDAEGVILTLVGPGGRNGPATLVLSPLPLVGWPRFMDLKAGILAELDPLGRLVIGRDLVVDLSRAKLWRRPTLEAGFDAQRLQRNHTRAAGLAFELRGRDGLGPLLPHWHRLLYEPNANPPRGLGPLPRLAWGALAALLQAWQAGQAEAVGRAASQLVGLGPGQTPSGDDLLAGLMVADERLHTLKRAHSCASDDRAHSRALLRTACLQAARGRTTDLGLARLRFAAEGDLDERSELVIAALIMGDSAEVEAATGELLGYGHSSGLDTLLGLLLGLAINQSPPQEERGC
jgi:hypothetical protein